ncbi:MAG TPA: error-prone DNA polymerase [Acidimicrobiales bacterium]|jgi:error-prone DNA polymerase|nr:error-prone DNA polymerase [Acidimicrobiales bacterium]
MATYGELHAHSGFSFLDGASDPEELVVEATRLGLSGLALSDHHGLYGVVRFAEAARAVGLASVFGTEVTLNGNDDRVGVSDPSGEHLVLLARSPTGYAALSRMLALAHLERGEKGSPRFTLDQVSNAAKEWLVLTGCRKGPLTRALLDEGPRAAQRRLAQLIERFGRENVAVEIWDHGQPDDVARNDALAELAVRADVAVVATNNVHYAAPRDFPRASVLAAIRARRSLEEMEGWLSASPLAHLRSDSEQRRRFARWPGVVDRAGELVAELAFDLRLVAPNLPAFATPEGHDEQSYLEELVANGATQRYGPRDHERVVGAWRQIDHELSVIKTLGFAGYFLTVWDITEFCRTHDIYCQGRGSAANSAVCYSLGITNADAVALNLFFERFLSPARDGPPDIDVDIESGRREEVIQYVYERYGRHHAAQVAAVITYRSRSALRDVARALGHSEEEANYIRDHVDRETMTSTDPAVSELLTTMAAELLDRPRHLGIHSAGMVLCDRPVLEVCPVEWGRMPGRSVLQWDKDDCAAIGLVKFDLLGLGMLEALHRAVDSVEAFFGVRLDLAALPQEDAVYDLLCEADTVGVFQVESRAQMATLPRVEPRCFYDLVIEVAIIRPGPIQGRAVNPFIRRRRGEEPVTYLHPRLEPILRRTLGVPLFQEQLMEMAVAVAGFSPAESDELRQAMAAKRSELRMMKLKSRFYAGMAENGITDAAADQLFDALAAFANFGFPESHSVSFAHLVYCSAWIKVHYPGAFLVSLLNAQPMGFWSTQSLVSDAQRHGVEVCRPDVNASKVGAALEGSPERSRVRLGLGDVRGVGSELAERIVAGAPWRNSADLVRRAGAQQQHLEALAAAGALDSFGASRRALTWSAGAAAQALPDRLPGVVTGEVAPLLPLVSELERVADDLWAMGLTTEATAMELVRPQLNARGVTRANALLSVEATRVSVAGVVTHRQHPETANGAVFVNLEDETGHVNVIFTKGAWARWSKVAGLAPALVIRGSLERGQGIVTLVAEFVEPLALGATTPSSRDWH